VPVRLRRQINPKESKEIQEKTLGFPWIPLAESGLINGLRRIQIKKSFPCHTVTEKPQIAFLAPTPAPPSRSSISQIYSMDSDYRKDIPQAFCFYLGPEFRDCSLRHVIVIRFPHLLPHCTIDFCSAAI
jgi:hypothetical protein